MLANSGRRHILELLRERERAAGEIVPLAAPYRTIWRTKLDALAAIHNHHLLPGAPGLSGADIELSFPPPRA